MNVGDILKNRGGKEYRIKKFINVAGEPGVELVPVNNGTIPLKLLKAYAEYYLGSGIFIRVDKRKRKRFRLKRK